MILNPIRDPIRNPIGPGIGPDQDGTIHFKTTGSSMDLDITVTGSPTILWTYDDGSTSDLADPGVVNFGSAATRYHTLYVSDNWADVTNFDAHDTATFAINLIEFKHLAMTGSLNIANTDSYGNIADFPSGLTGTLSCHGCSLLTGNIANFPSGLTESLLCYSCSLLTGNIANFPSGLTGSLYCYNCSLFTGNIADLPSGLTGGLSCSSCSLLTGNIADFPSGLTGGLSCNYCSLLTGDIADFPSGLIWSLKCNDTAISSYTSAAWPLATGNNKTLDFDDLSLSQADVDDILCDLVTHGATGGTLDLTGNAAPSAVGDACVTTLTVTLGWTVGTA